MPRKPKISEDEAFVRSHWNSVYLHGDPKLRHGGWVEIYKPGLSTSFSLSGGVLHWDLGSAWSAARKYTEAHLAKIAEVQREIDTLTWVASEYKSLEGEKSEIIRRTIARLSYIKNELELGML